MSIQMQEKRVPCGKLIVIGGNEAKENKNKVSENNCQNVDFGNGVLEELFKEMSLNPVIEIIPAASENQEEIGKNYVEAFARLNQRAKYMIINDRKEADLPENLQRLEDANIVFFTGGDQTKLYDRFAKTQFLKILKNKYENEDFIVAGTSSGAMVMAKNMIISGASDEAVLKGVVESKEGWGLISNVIIDTHFLSRGRIARLTESLLLQKESLGLGVCEDTGLVISEGRYVRTIGSGTVMIIEGKDIKNTNYNSLKEKDPIFIENLTMHILARGVGYDLYQRKFLLPDKKPESRKTAKKEKV